MSLKLSKMGLPDKFGCEAAEKKNLQEIAKNFMLFKCPLK
jgi:hypothetical protein